MNNEKRKRLLFFNLLIVSVAVVSYLLNKLFLGSTVNEFSFSLLAVYVFFASSALIIYLSLELSVAYIGDKIAYLFLFTVMIKLGLFLVIFYGKSNPSVPIPLSGKLSMIFALFVFLSIEGYATFKVLISNQNEEK
jgi:hypothetical protein